MTTTRYTSAPDPIITVWTYHGPDGLAFGGRSPSDASDVVRALDLDGHAVVTDSRYWRPSNHHVAGIGMGHDDARFAETGGREGSMAAYCENGGGSVACPRWWEDGSFAGRVHFGIGKVA